MEERGMSLCGQLQELLERTYSRVDVRLEDCVVGPGRVRQLDRLSGGLMRESEARTYLRMEGGNLYMAIYFSPALIKKLEELDPRKQLNGQNLFAFLSFIEEITHGVHAAIAFRNGAKRIESESFLCDLELLARIDMYYLLLGHVCRLSGCTPGDELRRWARHVVFDSEDISHGDRAMARRYRIANALARRFVLKVEPWEPRDRIEAIRDFRGLGLFEKALWLLGKKE